MQARGERRYQMKGFKRAVGVLLVLALMGAPAVVYAADAIAQDTVVDKVGDWMATLGKSGTDKDAILAQRKAERAAARTKRMAEKQAKKAQKEAEKAGKELKKSLKGLGQ